jgi:cell division cycle 14
MPISTLLEDKLFITFEDDVATVAAKHLSSKLYVPFQVNKKYRYTSFFADFGPLDLGLTYSFCCDLHEALQSALAEKKTVLIIAEQSPHQRSNHTVLVLGYLILFADVEVIDAYRIFLGEEPMYPFRDAGFCLNTFPITVLDCAMAMYKAKSKGHFSRGMFLLLEY